MVEKNGLRGGPDVVEKKSFLLVIRLHFGRSKEKFQTNQPRRPPVRALDGVGIRVEVWYGGGGCHNPRRQCNVYVVC